MYWNDSITNIFMHTNDDYDEAVSFQWPHLPIWQIAPEAKEDIQLWFLTNRLTIRVSDAVRKTSTDYKSSSSGSAIHLSASSPLHICLAHFMPQA